MSGRRGFTLIELLVVVTIITIVSSMLTVMVGIAQRKAKQTNTRAILMKVDQAIRLFRNDTGTYPFQTDLSNADADPSQWTNDLGFRLAWKPVDAAERATYVANLQDDLTAIHAKFFFKNGKNVPPTGDSSEGTHAFRFGDYYSPADANFKTNLLLREGSLSLTDDKFTNQTLSMASGGACDFMIPGWSNSGSGTALALTRMADEISSLRYLSGQLPVEAPKGFDPTIPADKALRPNLDARYSILRFWTAFVGSSYSPSIGTTYTSYHYVPYNKPGWYADDSRGPVLTTAAAKARGWRSEFLAETLRQQVAVGSPGELDPTRTTILDAYGRPLVYVCTFTPGARGFAYGLGGGAGDEANYGMTPVARVATSSLSSDIRTTAAPTYAIEFELWSAGPDGRFASLRDDPVNRDNLSMLPYNKDLR